MSGTDTIRAEAGTAHMACNSGQYVIEYSRSLAERWDTLLDWDARAVAEGGFFVEQLRARGVTQVLDAATGTGFHSLQLLEAGFEVTSVDGSAPMLAQAFENALRRGHILRPVQTDWRWLRRDVHALYDAVICLGNSFAHLHSEQERRKALAEFSATLRYRGVLVIDHRNYDALLDGRLEPRRERHYTGRAAFAAPIHIDEQLARFRLEVDDGSAHDLSLFPLRRAYVQRLLREVGFQRVVTFADFRHDTSKEEPDFFVHLAAKM